MPTTNRHLKVPLDTHPIIIARYRAGESCSVLGLAYNTCASNIQRILKRHGVLLRQGAERAKRIYTLNETFFSIIDTEAKAYFLGLLMADGCNVEEVGCVQISLQAQDRSILEAMCVAIGSNRPLTLKKPYCSNCQEQYLLRAKCRRMSNDLVALGCTSRKSLTLRFPTSDQVPLYLLHHFVRGYFDGDGTIYRLIQAHQYRMSMCTSHVFGETYRQVIRDQLNIHVTLTKRPGKKITEATISGARQVRAVYDWLYQDATLWIKRKRIKWDEINAHLDTFQRPHSSRYVGVCYYKANRQYGAYICHEKRSHFIGLFPTERQAAEAYNQRVTELGLSKCLNVII